MCTVSHTHCNAHSIAHRRTLAYASAPIKRVNSHCSLAAEHKSEKCAKSTSSRGSEFLLRSSTFSLCSRTHTHTLDTRFHGSVVCVRQTLEELIQMRTTGAWEMWTIRGLFVWYFSFALFFASSLWPSRFSSFSIVFSVSVCGTRASAHTLTYSVPCEWNCAYGIITTVWAKNKLNKWKEKKNRSQICTHTNSRLCCSAALRWVPVHDRRECVRPRSLTCLCAECVETSHKFSKWKTLHEIWKSRHSHFNTCDQMYLDCSHLQWQSERFLLQQRSQHCKRQLIPS